MILGENFVELTYEEDEFIVVAAHYGKEVYYPILFNGNLTGMSLPGVKFGNRASLKWIYENIHFGPGEYNKKRMQKFFQKIIPEEFL